MDRRLDAVDRALEVEGEIGLNQRLAGVAAGHCGTRA